MNKLSSEQDTEGHVAVWWITCRIQTSQQPLDNLLEQTSIWIECLRAPRALSDVGTLETQSWWPQAVLQLGGALQWENDGWRGRSDRCRWNKALQRICRRRSQWGDELLLSYHVALTVVNELKIGQKYIHITWWLLHMKLIVFGGVCWDYNVQTCHFKSQTLYNRNIIHHLDQMWITHWVG